MADRTPPWYQHQPFPTIVGVLLDHGLLREGGRDACKLAARIASSSTKDVGDRHAAVIAALVREHLVENPHDVRTAQAARDVLDVLVLHEAP